MNKKTIGIILASISALSFGIAPVFTSITLSEGSNGVMTMFLRNLLSIPILLLLVLILKLKTKLTIKQFFQLIFLNIVGAAMTGCLLFTSYKYTGIGLATCLHFVYPVVIMISCLVIFKERANIFKISALILSVFGIFLTVDISNFSVIGFSFAVLSGFTYAFYILYIDKTNIKLHNVIIITLYSCIINAISIGIFALITNKFTLDITPKGYGAAFIVAIMSTLVGIAFLQVSLQFIDSSTAAIMSTLEPLASVTMGILVLSEGFNIIKFFGCIFIIIAVFLIAIDNRRGYIGNMNN